MQVKKILIVDDSATGLAQTKSLFSRTRCAVITAIDGKDALKKISDERPDIVLMDLYMPEMNGDECCRIIKEDPSFKDIPIIMYTSAKGEGERKRCLLAGCDVYLTRPFVDEDTLLKTVKKFIDIPIRNHIRVSIEAEVTYFHNGKEYSGRMQNVSSTGGFIETAEPLPTGSIINLSFTIPNTANRVEAVVEVIRIIPKDSDSPSTRIVPGIGIQFITITWEGKKIIDGYVKTMERKRMTVA
ncbi:MAG: response regulator receiver modulated PilZ sensor protein [Deltaproteobacteria bacterium]|nr:response regulator receiver modulated PilZ sensor protein [Deltaproteobacteria bacterium]